MEILAPAGGEQSAYAALLAGADAVYLGLTDFSARAGAENFDLAALARTAEFAHVLGAKVYVALNTLVKDDETARFFSLAEGAWNAGADAILLQDHFLGKLLKECRPEMTLHLSTQAGCCNAHVAKIAKEYGFSRAVLARETPIEEIAAISKIIETEVFVQGALCTCFSGQCYLSSFAGNNSGNRGRCKQPCRKRYSIDRKGYEPFSYALSLSDLCVGERVKQLREAGVTSLKIEGRLRRGEYVASAVGYYRKLLKGESAKDEFSRLKRAFNRGDYTAGLAFGQDNTFLSRKVQGHVGERVGEVSVKNGRYFCKSNFSATGGDGFKILRRGQEVGGAVFSASHREGFFLASNAQLRTGDEVRVTTDTAANAAALAVRHKREILLDLYFKAGEKPVVACGEFTFTGERVLERAERAPLTAEQLKECFLKTDALPLAPLFGRVETDGVFLPKSALNALRRDFYARLKARLAPPKQSIRLDVPEAAVAPVRGNKTAVISPLLTKCGADILVYKPADYSACDLPEGGEADEVYLYLPPFFTGADERLIARILPFFDGVYCDGAYGIALSEKYGKPLFAGTGFNLTNRYAVSEISRVAKYYCLSKELTLRESEALAGEGAFTLTCGSVKVMDLCYCPFERSCSSCDMRPLYRMTDEDGRVFPLRRYRLTGGACRFEVYNCAPLAGERTNASCLADCSAGELTAAQAAACARDTAQAKRFLKHPTTGHTQRSLL